MFIFIFDVLLLLAIFCGFVFVQIKGRPVWRLLSSVVVLLFCCWAGAQYGELEETATSAEFFRRTHEFVDVVDQLNTEGRTNEIHQACQKFADIYVIEGDGMTNLGKVIEGAAQSLAQPHALTPTTAATSNSTNR
jgi:hypothetical protein